MQEKEQDRESAKAARWEPTPEQKTMAELRKAIEQEIARREARGERPDAGAHEAWRISQCPRPVCRRARACRPRRGEVCRADDAIRLSIARQLEAIMRRERKRGRG